MQSRIDAFHTALSRDEIDLDEIRELMSSGVPEGQHRRRPQQPPPQQQDADSTADASDATATATATAAEANSVLGLRSVCWKLLLGYLPTRRAEWQDYLRVQRSNFRSFYREFMGLEFPFSPSHAATATASAASAATESEPGSGGSAFTFDSVPLDGDSDGGRHVAEDDDNLPVFGPEMASADTIEDRKLKDDIRKDITRTLSVMHFFVSSADGCRVSDKQLALERVLYIFGKLNAGIRYVQGMNEILAPIFYTFFTDPATAFTFEDPALASFSSDVEADAFFCFNVIMSEVRDWFVPSADASRHGIHRYVEWMDATVRFVDPLLHQHLEEQEILPSYYSFRWLTTLLAREFLLPDVQRIWDSLFSDPQRFQLLVFAGVAMITLARDSLLAAEFVDCVGILQNYPTTDVQLILRRAAELRRRLCRHHAQVHKRLRQQQQEEADRVQGEAAVDAVSAETVAEHVSDPSAAAFVQVTKAEVSPSESYSSPDAIPRSDDPAALASTFSVVETAGLASDDSVHAASLPDAGASMAASADSALIAQPAPPIDPAPIAANADAEDADDDDDEAEFPSTLALFSTLTVPAAFSATPHAAAERRAWGEKTPAPWYLKYEFSEDGSEMITVDGARVQESASASVIKRVKSSINQIASFFDSPTHAAGKESVFTSMLSFDDLDARPSAAHAVSRPSVDTEPPASPISSFFDNPFKHLLTPRVAAPAAAAGIAKRVTLNVAPEDSAADGSVQGSAASGSGSGGSGSSSPSSYESIGSGTPSHALAAAHGAVDEKADDDDDASFSFARFLRSPSSSSSAAGSKTKPSLFSSMLGGNDAAEPAASTGETAAAAQPDAVPESSVAPPAAAEVSGFHKFRASISSAWSSFSFGSRGSSDSDADEKDEGPSVRVRAQSESAAHASSGAQAGDRAAAVTDADAGAAGAADSGRSADSDSAASSAALPAHQTPRRRTMSLFDQFSLGMVQAIDGLFSEKKKKPAPPAREGSFL